MTERAFCFEFLANAPVSTHLRKAFWLSIFVRSGYVTNHISYKSEWNREFIASLSALTLEEAFFHLNPSRKNLNKENGIMFDRIKEDVAAVRDRDPAARSFFEILFLYPGVKAIRMYRRSHWLFNHNFKFLARWISQRAVRKTGIEIHPGAIIGKRLVIDHGTGVVIGETAEIGDDCLIYQGVTLGGTGKDIGKRHPTIGNNVMISSGAKVLGPFKVGNNSRIAAGAVVLDEVPPNCTVVGVPARVVRQEGQKVGQSLDQIHMPDPVALELCKLEYQVGELKKQLDDLTGNNKTDNK